MTSIAERRRRAPAFDLAQYGARLEEFVAELGEARWALATGASAELNSAGIFGRHADLFSRKTVDALRRAAAGSDDDAARAQALVASAVDAYAGLQVARMTDQIAAAEARAVIVWRGERIAYRHVPERIAQMSDRAERNGLAASFDEAVELINPLREERLDRQHAVATELGYADYPSMLAETRGFDLSALTGEMQRFMIESETPYFAALRRYLAEIDIEQGDATIADLSHILTGNGWNAWFEPRRLLASMRSTLSSLGIDLAAQTNVQLDLDLDPRSTGEAGPSVVVVRVPQDLRLAMRPAGGNHDYARALRGIGQLEQLAHVAADLPTAYRLGGDQAVTTGFGLLFEHLLLNDGWLTSELSMSDEEIVGWVDFASFRRLHAMRRDVARVFYELRLHGGDRTALHRAYYSGMLGLLTGVRYTESGYLAGIQHGFESAVSFRGACFAATFEMWLTRAHGADWWRSQAAAGALRRGWSRGQSLNADALVAHLGYDRLDWRPILRQIRTQLIGEMSGYGGPNITTRAGTRKV